LTLTNGVVLGTYGPNNSYGISIGSGGSLISGGSPTALNRIVRYNTVQEQSSAAWSASTVGASLKKNSSAATVNTRFTGWSLLAGVGDHFNDTSGGGTPTAFSHSQFGGGKFTIYASSTALTNCLWERVAMAIEDNHELMEFAALNNLMRGGSLSLTLDKQANNWLLKDNLFDQVAITTQGNGTITHDYNGYVTNQSRLYPNGAHDVILTDNPVYQTSWLGNYYYPTNDGMLSQLFDKGSSPADDVGLYHYTTTTNQVKETNSVVEIGFHYVAVDTNGVPFDTDGDGVPDYNDPDSTPRTDIFWSNGVWHWKPASLAWNCWTNALACTNGAQGDFYNIFTAFSTPDRRNTNFWFRRFMGWPAYSVWNNCNTNLWPTNGAQTCMGSMTYQHAGILVSPEHVLTAGHMYFPSNHWLVFMDLSNNVVFRQVKDYFHQLPPSHGTPTTNNVTTNMPSPPFWDYYIGLLDNPVPDNIGYVRVIPTNWWAWFDAPFYNNATNNAYHVPLYIQNCQHRTPVMKDLVTLTCDSGHRRQTFDLLTLTNWNHDTMQGGDSGSPWFLTLDGELCLACVLSSALYFGVEYEYIDAAYVQACVNAAMRELSLRNGRTNIYALTVKDLSKYPIYHQSYNCSP
jgi:hypothetical protein